MKNALIAAAVLSLLAPAARAKEGGKDAPTTLAGEILDLSCYMAHEGQGAAHAKCAKQCVMKGTPMGLKTADGKVYLLLSDHGKEKAYDAAKELAGGQAKITGKMLKRSGVTALSVEKAEAAK